MTERCKRNPCCGDLLDCKPPPQFKPRESYEEYQQRSALSPAATPGLAMPSREWMRDKIAADPDVEDCGAVSAATPVSEAWGEAPTCYNTGLRCLAGCDGRTCAGANVPLNQWPEPALAKPASSPAGGEPTGNSGLLLGEASADDAPCYLSSEHADSWAKGFNAAVRALSQSTSAGRGE